MDQSCYIKCPDCGKSCEVRLILLTSDGGLMNFAKCPYCFARCGDKRSVRGRMNVNIKEWQWAATHGMPVVEVS